MKFIKNLTILTAMFLTLSACGGPSETDLSNGIDVTFDGYNGYGTISIVENKNLVNILDTSTIQSYINSLSDEILIEKSIVEDEGLNALINYVPRKNYDNLTNGDTVVIDAVITDVLASKGESLTTLQEKLGITFKNTSFSFNVSDLKDGEVFDIAEMITPYIEFKGENHTGTASVNIPDDFEEVVGNVIFVKSTNANTIEAIKDNRTIAYLTFSFNKKANLSNGEKINLSIASGDRPAVEDALMNAGVVPILDAEITCPDFSILINTDELLTNSIKSSIVEEFIKDASKYNYSDFELKDAYWGTNISSNSKDTESYQNIMLTAVYKTDGQLSSLGCIYGIFEPILYHDGTIKINKIAMNSEIMIPVVKEDITNIASVITSEEIQAVVKARYEMTDFILMNNWKPSNESLTNEQETASTTNTDNTTDKSTTDTTTNSTIKPDPEI